MKEKRKTNIDINKKEQFLYEGIIVEPIKDIFFFILKIKPL
jgi:hypothetical protein